MAHWHTQTVRSLCSARPTANSSALRLQSGLLRSRQPTLPLPLCCQDFPMPSRTVYIEASGVQVRSSPSLTPTSRTPLLDCLIHAGCMFITCRRQTLTEGTAGCLLAGLGQPIYRVGQKVSPAALSINRRLLKPANEASFSFNLRPNKHYDIRYSID